MLYLNRSIARYWTLEGPRDNWVVKKWSLQHVLFNCSDLVGRFPCITAMRRYSNHPVIHLPKDRVVPAWSHHFRSRITHLNVTQMLSASLFGVPNEGNKSYLIKCGLSKQWSQTIVRTQTHRQRNRESTTTYRQYLCPASSRWSPPSAVSVFSSCRL